MLPRAIETNNTQDYHLRREAIMREFTLCHLHESWSAPGGRQLVGQAANLTFESARRLLQTEHSPIAICIITQP